MKILGIETSCDETAVAIVEAEGGASPVFKVLSSVVSSQMKLHSEWGGVVPMLAKREHARNLVPVLEKALREAGLYVERSEPLQATSYPPERGRSERAGKLLATLLVREPELIAPLTTLLQNIEIPAIDAIAVTKGPGLEPALWVGVNFSQALAAAWQKPLYPVNHMEGHILAALLPSREEVKGKSRKVKVEFPILSLLVSGGHTELDLLTDWRTYQILGETRDDAVGEAFDKVARLLGLPYPGGPAISALALKGEANPRVVLPRPMLHSKDLDFSFAGIKTAVRYLIEKLTGMEALLRRSKASLSLDEQTKADIALEFQNAVVEVLVSKVDTAVRDHAPKTFILGGGVAANIYLRDSLSKLFAEKHPDVQVILPSRELTTDNAAMIAAAAYLRITYNMPPETSFRAQGNLRVTDSGEASQ